MCGSIWLLVGYYKAEKAVVEFVEDKESNERADKASEGGQSTENAL